MMKQLVRIVLVCLLFATPAAAQMEGTIAVGVGVGKVKTTASELESKFTVQPIVTRLPSEGWGFAFAFNWFSADVNGSVVGVGEDLGRVATRPLMLGVGYTMVRGRFSLSPSVVAGPSVNTLKIDDRWDGIFEIGGSGFEEQIGTISFAARPGVNATYALASHVGITGFGGYLVNRPEFTVNTPAGETEVKWKGDGWVFNTGIIFSF